MSEIDALKIELDVLKIANNTLKSGMSKMKEENKLLREVLKFYADSKTYNGEYIDCGKDGIHTSTPIIYIDQGYKAEQVLKNLND